MTSLSGQSEGLPVGVRVVDLTRILAGLYDTILLGDLGVEVIKIEVPGRGDDPRQWGPPFTAGGDSVYFLAANRNKRSLRDKGIVMPGEDVGADLRSLCAR